MAEEKKDGFVIRDKRFWVEPEGPESLPPEEVVVRAAPEAEVEKLRAALADLEDSKLRLHRDAERQVTLLRGNVLEKLLPVIDNLERCIAAADQAQNVEGLLAGVKLVESQFLRVLADFGLERVSTVGDRFDPRIHDAIAIVPVEDSAKDGIVVDEIEPAYRFGDRIVRPAKVQVGRAPSRPEAWNVT